MMMTKIKTYSELITLPTFRERLEYLQLNGEVGAETFGFDRCLNQEFYRSSEWKRIRREIIIRDNGCDLGVEDYDILCNIIIHHMNPIDQNDIIKHSDFLVNPEYLICTKLSTHNAIHYGDIQQVPDDIVVRKPNDTCPWRH